MIYAAAIALSWLLVYLAAEFRARFRSVRRRAAFEHMLADFSLSLVGALEVDLDELIRHALGDLAKSVHADRAYLLLEGGTGREWIWYKSETSLVARPAGQLAPLLERLDMPDGEEIQVVPQVARLPEGPARSALLAAGLEGWVCASRRGRGGDRALLGFGVVTPRCRITPACETGLLRMALDVMAGAFEQRALAQDQARLATRLEQARRLETVGTLTSGIAHNFNNIVGAILGYTEMARERKNAGCGAENIFADIERAGERGRQLVDEILTFARPRDKPHGWVDLRSLVGETVSLLGASLPASVELTVTQEEGAMAISGAPAQLQQVVLNLCRNAAQAMENAGRIDLSLVCVDLAAGMDFAGGTLPPGRYAQLAVSDNGPGIGTGNQERIFEPFFTTKTDGTGLGLATSMEIVREHGGAMSVSSAPGQGARFEIWLPLLPVETFPEEISGPSFGNGETILVVAADPRQLLRNEEMLAALGYEPVGFRSAAGAAEACRLDPERFDLAFIDHVGSDSSILDGVAALHDAVPALPVLAIIAPSDMLDAGALVSAGVYDVLARPFAAAEVAAALAEGMRRKGSGMPDGRHNLPAP